MCDLKQLINISVVIRITMRIQEFLLGILPLHFCRIKQYYEFCWYLKNLSMNSYTFFRKKGVGCLTSKNVISVLVRIRIKSLGLEDMTSFNITEPKKIKQ